MKKIAFFMLIVAAFLLSACGTTVNVKPTDGSLPSEESLKLSFASVAIEVKTEVEDSQEEAQMFKDFLANEFKERNITVAESGTDAKMMVIIKHLKKVSKTSRFFWGSLAGSAEIKADIAIKTKTANSSFFVNASARGASGFSDYMSAYGGSTEDLLNRTAKKIAEKIL